MSLSRIEYGEYKDWTALNVNDWYNKYLLGKLNTVNTEMIDGVLCLYLADGTAVTSKDINHWNFFPFASDVKKCLKDKQACNSGKESFIFFYNPAVTSLPDYCSSPNLYHYNKGIEPYLFWENRHWDDTNGCAALDIPSDNTEIIEILKNNGSYGCYVPNKGAYCTALIRQNGWKIPEDYPYFK